MFTGIVEEICTDGCNYRALTVYQDAEIRTASVGCLAETALTLWPAIPAAVDIGGWALFDLAPVAVHGIPANAELASPQCACGGFDEHDEAVCDGATQAPAAAPNVENLACLETLAHRFEGAQSASVAEWTRWAAAVLAPR